jgi:hypothetical protein
MTNVINVVSVVNYYVSVHILMTGIINIMWIYKCNKCYVNYEVTTNSPIYQHSSFIYIQFELTIKLLCDFILFLKIIIIIIIIETSFYVVVIKSN